MAIFPSSFTMTALANSFPGVWVEAAIICALYAGECAMVTYFT
jgi:hypothetical protein